MYLTRSTIYILKYSPLNKAKANNIHSVNVGERTEDIMSPPKLVRKKKDRLGLLRVLHEQYQLLVEQGLGYLKHRVRFLDKIMAKAESELMRNERTLSRRSFDPR